MQLDTITIHCTNDADMRRLRHAGGAVWESCEHEAGRSRRLFWRVRLPAVTVIRMGLIALGSELSEVTNVAERPLAKATRGA
ncbi:MAG TPA: hypothetical protein VGF38_01500 [Ktedonobacterales bacterium]